MKTISRQQAISLLLNLFNDNKLTFRSITVLKEVFDEAVEQCNEEREEIEAETIDMRNGFPNMPSRDSEDDFYDKFKHIAEERLSQTLKSVDEKTVEAVAELLVENGEYQTRDVYLI